MRMIVCHGAILFEATAKTRSILPVDSLTIDRPHRSLDDEGSLPARANPSLAQRAWLSLPVSMRLLADSLPLNDATNPQKIWLDTCPRFLNRLPESHPSIPGTNHACRKSCKALNATLAAMNHFALDATSDLASRSDNRYRRRRPNLELGISPARVKRSIVGTLQPSTSAAPCASSQVSPGTDEEDNRSMTLDATISASWSISLGVIGHPAI
jgi:hypothetical protein